MSAKLGTLTVDLLAKTGSFETDIKRAAKTTDSSMSRIGASATKAGVILGTALVAGAGAAALAIKSAIDRADELSKASQKIGITTEALSGLAFAAELSDVSFQELQGGVTKLIRAQEQAASGSGELAETFRAIGVSATDSTGKLRDADKVLLDLADVFQSLPDGAEKTALAVDIFGRSGANLIPLLNSGADGIRGMTSEAAELGLILDSQTGKAAEEFNDNLTRLKASSVGLTNELTSSLLPALVGITDALVDVVKAGKTAFAKDGLFADDFFSSDSGLIAQLYRDRGFESPGLINDGTGPTLPELLGGARAPSPVEFITGDNVGTAGAGAGAGRRDGSDIEAALRKQREARDKSAESSRGASEADRAFAAAQREAAAAAAELQRAIEERDRAQADFTLALEDYRAEVEGPLAQAELDWERRQTQLEDLAKRGEISQEQLAEALEVTTELRLRDVEAITSQLSPAQELIAALDEELRLLGLSNIEREIAIARRQAGADASEEELAIIEDGIRRIDQARQDIAVADDVRAGFEDTFASIIDGSKSAKDALEDLGTYITQLIARKLATQLTESLFGGFGGPLGGSAGGGGFGAFLGSLFGGGRAAGGFVSPGKMYEVGEQGPELLRVGGRQFLLPSASGGTVTPNAKVGGGGGVVQNFNVTGRIDARTASQIAAESGRAQRRVSARFGA